MTQLPRKVLLTDSVIGAFPPIEAGRTCVRDAQLSQLTLLVGPRGRVWYMHCSMHARSHRLRLGPWPIVGTDEARDRCLEALRRLYRGEPAAPPKAAPANAVPTLSTILTEYLEARKLSRQASADLRSIVNKHAATWLVRPIDALQARDIARDYRKIAETSQAQANRLLGALSALSRYAHAAHGVGDAALIQRVRALLGSTDGVEARSVTIVDDAQAKWHAAVLAETPAVARYLQALALTGMRANELRRLPRAGWRAGGGVLHVATTKNGKAHTLPVGLALRAIVEAEGEARAEGSALFDVPVKVYRAACERIGAAIGFDWHLHDLRRTFATAAARCSIDGAVIKRLMNHSASGDVTAKHYVQRTVDDLREPMQAIEAHLSRLWTATK